MDHLLDKTEGAEPAAGDPTDETADHRQAPDHIETELSPAEGQVELDRAQGVLERPDGAGADRRGTGVAVEHRDADSFCRALVDLCF